MSKPNNSYSRDIYVRDKSNATLPQGYFKEG